VNEKFRTAMWTNHSGRKKTYYIKEFNPNCDHSEKTYLGASIKGKDKIVSCTTEDGSHHLRCETDWYPRKFGRKELAYSTIRVWWRWSGTLPWNVQPMRIFAVNMKTT
jgi:hypothetical protein